MGGLLRCRSCGFVAEEGRVGEVCPVCGVPRKMFEPFTDAVSARRRRRLDLDIHPIVVHFSVSFAVSAFAAALFLLVFPGAFRQTLTGAFRTVAAALPVLLIVSYVTGRYDAALRFRKARSPLLSRKKAVGICFFLLSAAAAGLTFGVGPFVAWVRAVDVVLFAGCSVCAFVQGRAGGMLMRGIFPG